MAAAATPYLVATLAPPPGRVFTGFFWFQDDAYNYLSFAQQAEDGAFLFRNKLVLEPHAPALVNLEWWLVGRLSLLLGHRPVLAYRVFGAAATFALVLALARWLADTGVPASHLPAALGLLCAAAGAGGVRLLLGVSPPRCLDFATGLFPIIEILANPHFVAGTALLLWSLRALAGPLTLARVATAAALGGILSLTRPYDFVLLVAIRAVVVAVSEPPRTWWRHGAAMVPLLPLAAYQYWLFYRNPAFASFARPYLFPRFTDFLWALGPAAALLAAAWAWPGPARPRLTPAALHLVAWTCIGALVIALHPVHFSLQFLVGIGAPLLALAALGLSRFAPAVTAAAAVALASTAVVALWFTMRPNTAWHVPAERMAVATALRDHCRPGDVVLAPPDIGLWAGGLTSCTPFVSHPAAEGYAERDEASRAFYEGRPGAASLLEAACVAHVVAPAAPGLDALAGPGGRYREVATVGSGPHAVKVYSRARDARCRARRE